MSQRRLAAAASLDLDTVVGLERGRGTLGSLIAVLTALNAGIEGADNGVGPWLRQLRKDRHLTQIAASKFAGVSNPTVIKLERGAGQISTFLRLLAAYSVNPFIASWTTKQSARWSVIHGDALSELRTMASASFDCAITDPPYALADHSAASYRAMLTSWVSEAGPAVSDTGLTRSYLRPDWNTQHWDDAMPDPVIWQEVHRVLRAGAHLCVFAAPRLSDITCMALRLAGFEIRDQIVWVTRQSTRTSMDVGRTLARANARRDGSIDFGNVTRRRYPRPGGGVEAKRGLAISDQELSDSSVEAAILLDQFGGIKASLRSAHESIIIARKRPAGTTATSVRKSGIGGVDHKAAKRLRRAATNVVGDLGPQHEPYFVCPRTGADERNRFMPPGLVNDHPTVKPIALIEYLIALYAPEGGRVLDCYAGSGTTGIACALGDREFVGIELNGKFAEIARMRVGNAALQFS